jgi:arsenical pump membrane protein
MTLSQEATCAIAALATMGVIVRPWGLPEALWAVLGALGLVALRLLSWPAALRAVASGTDVYLFLSGMMLLAELARSQGVFDWIATHAVQLANGSAQRLFGLVFCVGTAVTVLLSNDATAVVLTPAVLASAKAAKAEPMPYLFICALVANAASFVLPISNPANIVIFGDHMPALAPWIEQFALPSVVSIAATYCFLRFNQREALRKPIIADTPVLSLPSAGHWTLIGIGVCVMAMLAASALHLPLGLPTFAVAALSVTVVLFKAQQSPVRLVKQISWSVLILVAGLFVLVAGVAQTGAIQRLGDELAAAGALAPVQTGWLAGASSAVLCNLINNLPAGLIAHTMLSSGQPIPGSLTNAMLIGIDLGPNLSITGSLATILWLVALRREGLSISAWSFSRVGLIVATPAILLALAASALAATIAR